MHSRHSHKKKPIRARPPMMPTGMPTLRPRCEELVEEVVAERAVAVDVVVLEEVEVLCVDVAELDDSGG